MSFLGGIFACMLLLFGISWFFYGVLFMICWCFIGLLCVVLGFQLILLSLCSVQFLNSVNGLYGLFRNTGMKLIQSDV